MTTQLMTADQAAEFLALDVQQVRAMTRRGEFGDVAINLAAGTKTPDGGNRRPIWRYDSRRLERWLDARRGTAA